MTLYRIIYIVMTVSTGYILKCTDRGPWASGIVQYADGFSFVFLFVTNVILLSIVENILVLILNVVRLSVRIVFRLFLIIFVWREHG